MFEFIFKDNIFIVKDKDMNKKTKISLILCLLIASVNLFAQEQHNFNLINKYFPARYTKNIGNYSNRLEKNGFKVRLDSITTLNWNTTTNSYEANSVTRKFYYDAVGNNILQVEGILMEPDEYSNLNKSEITYNKKNKAILVLKTTVVGVNTWINYEKVEKIYDDKDNNTITKFYQWNTNDGKWELYSFIYLNYNDNHLIISEIDSVSDKKNKSVTKIDFIYNSKGNNISTITTNLLNSGCPKFYKTDNTFDIDNNLTNADISFWDSTRNEWLVGYKLLNTINTKGETIESIYHCWDRNTNTPSDNSSRIVFIYNSTISIDEVAFPRNIELQEVNYRNQILTINIQNQKNNNWINNQLQTYYYSPFKANTNEVTKTNIIIYPNPTTGIVNINTIEKIENINITDINGKLVYYQTNNSPIDLSQNVKGIYFMNIISEKGVINKKIVLY